MSRRIAYFQEDLEVVITANRIMQITQDGTFISSKVTKTEQVVRTLKPVYVEDRLTAVDLLKSQAEGYKPSDILFARIILEM